MASRGNVATNVRRKRTRKLLTNPIADDAVKWAQLSRCAQHHASATMQDRVPVARYSIPIGLVNAKVKPIGWQLGFSVRTLS